jgi:hypothetical protein
MSKETEKPDVELYAGQHEEQQKRAERLAELDRAHATVLPGALREAFAGEPSVAEGHKLQPVTLGLAANLERIGSPLLEVVRIMREVYSAAEGSGGESPREGKNEIVNERVSGLEFKPEQIAETVFVFTRSQKRIRKLLDAGRDKFREAAMEELGDRLHPLQMAALQRACAQHYVMSFATIIGYGVPPPEGETVFPAPSPSGATGSVGG